MHSPCARPLFPPRPRLHSCRCGQVPEPSQATARPRRYAAVVTRHTAASQAIVAAKATSPSLHPWATRRCCCRQRPHCRISGPVAVAATSPSFHRQPLGHNDTLLPSLVPLPRPRFATGSSSGKHHSSLPHLQPPLPPWPRPPAVTGHVPDGGLFEETYFYLIITIIACMHFCRTSIHEPFALPAFFHQ